MSRSVRDLRELICASRLSYRDQNDNEEFSETQSDDLEEGEISAPRKVKPPKLPKRKKDLDPLKMKGKPLSPPASSGSSGGSCSPLPLPPIRPGTRSTSSSDSERDLTPKEKLETEERKIPSPLENNRIKKGNFDWMLEYADSTAISDWLIRANKGVKDLTSWLHADSNFVLFAHFWLSEIPQHQKRELVEVEVSIIRDELCFAFGPGLEDKSVSQEDITSFLSAIFWEFPKKFSGSECGPFFLNILICLCSIRKDSYKLLLSDVKCGTEKRQFVQYIIATRAFAVINLCAGVVGFYKQISINSGLDSHIPSKDVKDVATAFVFDAVCKGFVDVVDYLLSNFDLDPHNVKSENGKSLLFTAVVSCQEEVIQYLLQIEPKLNVNEVSSSGNSVLHAAVNCGNPHVVEMLVSAGANLNTWNAECDGATPLHVAVMSGNCEMVSLMVQAGCDQTAVMGVPATVTPLKLAQDLGLEDIVKLLSKSNLTD